MGTGNCEICKKVFKWRGNRINRFTCSKQCKYIRFGNRTRNVKRPEYIGQKITLSKLGTHHSEQAKENMRLSHIGQKLKPETIEKLRIIVTGRKHSLETRQKLSEMFMGEKGCNWKGGVTPINNQIRKSLKYKLWREKVFERDDWTCQECNIRGGELRADHIKPFAYYLELRFKVENGRTLCEECHRKTDTYGSKVLNYQFS